MYVPLKIIQFRQVQLIRGLNAPEWLTGNWGNRYESNSNHLESIHFEKGRLRIGYGMGPELIKDYRDYTITEKTGDSLYKVSLQNSDSLIVYEFRYRQTDFDPDPIMTYTLVVNGKGSREHATSCQGFFSKQ